MKPKIKNIKAREILDSRANPTVEVELESGDEVFVASVPSGVSLGKYEAVELRDNGKRYDGRGVLKAVENINKIIGPALKGKDAVKQEEIDNLMIALDGTANKSRLGANAILAVSMAVCRAGAAVKSLPLWKYIAGLSGKKISLPTPSVLLIEGGLHAGNKLDFQEFMIMPQAPSFAQKLQQAAEVYNALKEILIQKYGRSATNVGFEGGLAAPLEKIEEALQLMVLALDKTGHSAKIALDAAASFFYKNNAYEANGKSYNTAQLLDFYTQLLNNYPIISLEDPFSDEDWLGFKNITDTLGGSVNIIGDDLLATNIERIQKAIEQKSCNGLLLKLNQIGTVSEGLEAANLAKSANWRVMVSHRAGETLDDFIADLAVGIGADYIKIGAPARGERVAKYNRLLKIEEDVRSQR